MTLRQDLLKQNPAIEKLFTPIADALDEQTLRDLNTQVDVDDQSVADVVRGFLEDEEFLSPRQLNK